MAHRSNGYHINIIQVNIVTIVNKQAPMYFDLAMILKDDNEKHFMIQRYKYIYFIYFLRLRNQLTEIIYTKYVTHEGNIFVNDNLQTIIIVVQRVSQYAHTTCILHLFASVFLTHIRTSVSVCFRASFWHNRFSLCVLYAQSFIKAIT